ncbi:MAG TPA: IPT/TIG domain-containing protein [Acidimicrobiales bacterium]|nr:IPT/TIG domain-containing protein [Acidimicrobiales bacterium]
MYTVTVTDTTNSNVVTATITVGAASFINFSTNGGSDGSYFGSGASGTFTLFDQSAPFAGDGGNTSVTTNAPGVTFSGVTNTSLNHNTITGSFASTSATVPGTYNVTVTDNAGTETYNNAFTVSADPTVTSLSVTSGSTIPTGNASPGGTQITETVTGSGFSDLSAANVMLTSTVDGTQLNVTAASTAGTEATPSSTASLTFYLQNSVTKGAATPGTYTLTITNGDGGSVTTGAIFTVVGVVVSNVSPSSFPTTGSVSYSITINGGGFQQNPTVALWNSGSTTVACSDASLSNVTVVSASQITATLTTAAGPTSELCDLSVTNSGPGDNQASFDLAGAVGFGTSASPAPTITSSSLTTATALTAGAPSVTMVLTGSGFGASNGTIVAKDPLGGTSSSSITGCVANGSGTTLTCNVFAGNSANSTGVEGQYTVIVNGGALPDAFSVSGPAITSISPTALAVGAPIGTVVAITGTGFSNTSTGTVGRVSGGDTLGGIFQYVSATSENFVVTSPPSVGGAVDSLAVTSVDAYGFSVASAPVNLAINADPTVSAITYATGTTGVGVGATAQPVVITGTGFESGVTVGSFVNSAGTADPNVTAKVTAVTATSITVAISVAAGDTNTIVGYTVTNPDGGSASVIAVAPIGLTLDAAPTITAVSPSTATPSSTNAFTITGTGFQTGAVVAASSNGTCGVATVASATSITVSCTLGAEGSSAVTLLVTNPDGGTATSATVLPAATTPPAPKPRFHVSAVHGFAVHGRTVTILIIGTGFYGQPKIVSTGRGVRAVVAKDNGKVLTVRVTTPLNVRGWHTFTVRLANGKAGKVNYLTK